MVYTHGRRRVAAMPTVTIQLKQSEMTALRRIAEQEVRTPEQQATYFVRLAIRTWKPAWLWILQGDGDEGEEPAGETED
jgi:hypothetical protein